MTDAYFDRAGKPIDLMTWSNYRDDRSYAVIGENTIAEGERSFTVSTQWMGYNLHSNPDFPPSLFQAVISGTGKPASIEGRWATEAEAVQSHTAMVNSLCCLFDNPTVT